MHLITLRALPPLFHGLTTYNLRNSDIFKTIEPSLTCFLTHSFLHQFISAWNDLPNDVQNAPSVAPFKYKLNRKLIARLNITMLIYAMYKFSTLGKDWGAALQIVMCIENHIVPSVLRVSEVASKVQLISFLPAQFSRMLGKDICLLILKITQIRNSYLEKQMQQSKITNHSSCKSKTLLLNQAYSFKLASCTLHILHACKDRSPVILYIICLYMLYMVILIAYPLGPSLCMHVNISKVYLNYCLLHNILHAGYFGSCESVQMHQLFRCQLI